MIWLILVALLILGATLPPGDIFHSFAVAFDIFAQDLAGNDTLGITISSRCGMMAHRGRVWPSKIVNSVMGSPTHCQDAIHSDILRAQKAIRLLAPYDG